MTGPSKDCTIKHKSCGVTSLGSEDIGFWAMFCSYYCEPIFFLLIFYQTNALNVHVFACSFPSNCLFWDSYIVMLCHHVRFCWARTQEQIFFNSHSYSCCCFRNVIRIFDSFEFHEVKETVKERINPKKNQDFCFWGSDVPKLLAIIIPTPIPPYLMSYSDTPSNFAVNFECHFIQVWPYMQKWFPTTQHAENQSEILIMKRGPK